MGWGKVLWLCFRIANMSLMFLEKPSLFLQIRSIRRSGNKLWGNMKKKRIGLLRSTRQNASKKGWEHWLLSLRTYCWTVYPITSSLSSKEAPAGYPIKGTLRSHDGDGNENFKKAIGLISKTTILHVHHAFLYISLPALHNYDVKLPNLTFYVGSKQTTTKISLFFWTWILL